MKKHWTVPAIVGMAGVVMAASGDVVIGVESGRIIRNMTSVSAAQPPEWLVTEMRRMVNEDDLWLTDNTPYRGDDEPWEQYGMEWQRAEDGNGITGRLFGLIGGEIRATFWQFRLSWDEERQVARMWQKNEAGMVGDGVMKPTGRGDETEAIQTFTAPDGTSFRVRHLATTTADTHTTQSFDRVDGQWQARRSYVWRKVRT